MIEPLTEEFGGNAEDTAVTTTEAREIADSSGLSQQTLLLIAVVAVVGIGLAVRWR